MVDTLLDNIAHTYAVHRDGAAFNVKAGDS